MSEPVPHLDPAFLVIFGITGDLAKRKLLPALYGLVKANLLPEPFEIIGITRREVSLDELLQDVELCISERDNVCDPTVVDKLKSMIHLFQMDVTNPSDYDRLLEELNSKEDGYGVHMNRLYYLSIPPQVFAPIVRLLGEHGHNASCQHGAASTRLLIEKPFGYDVSSAEQLIADLSVSYGDFQIYRIDHYLAKETAQNILAFRFENPLFEAVWDHDHVSQIVIKASETIGIEGRAAFYEQTGALRDLIQSHLLQLLALVTMERPETMESKEIHEAKLAALQAVQPIAPDQVAAVTRRGQYRGYLDEVQNPGSLVETYAAVTLGIDNDRWRGVPIHIETGKALQSKETTITVSFVSEAHHTSTNHLVMRIQPNEGITVLLQAKKPGLANETRQVDMHFDYTEAFQDVHPDAYERVLVDAVRGDKTLFATSEEVMASWRIIENVINEWAKSNDGLVTYEPGSPGPG